MFRLIGSSIFALLAISLPSGSPGALAAGNLFAERGASFCFDRELLGQPSDAGASGEQALRPGCTIIGMKGARVIVLETNEPTVKVRLYSRDGDMSYVGYMLKTSVVETPTLLEGPLAGTAQALPVTPAQPKPHPALGIAGAGKSPSLLPMQPEAETAGAGAPPKPCQPGSKTGQIGTAGPPKATPGIPDESTCR